ncbi:hypothetical protein ACO0QE_002064 [Hanseniaspora vineae]
MVAAKHRKSQHAHRSQRNPNGHGTQPSDYDESTDQKPYNHLQTSTDNKSATVHSQKDLVNMPEQTAYHKLNKLQYFDFEENFVNLAYAPPAVKKDKARLFPHSTRYSYMTSSAYLKKKYSQKAVKIKEFIDCIHCKITTDVNASRIKKFENLQNIDQQLREKTSLSPSASPQKDTDYNEKWRKMELFLLLVFLSQRGGPDYWCDQKAVDEETLEESQKPETESESQTADQPEMAGPSQSNDQNSRTISSSPGKAARKRKHKTLTEYIIKQNINKSYSEDSPTSSSSDVNYVYSSIWANFMEGLINHYMEEKIIPSVEKEVCFHLYIPMVRIMVLCHQYQMEQLAESPKLSNEDVQTQNETLMNLPVPAMITNKLEQLADLYTSLNGDEQDFQLEEFVFCAEEYIETVYIPHLIEVLFEHLKLGNEYVWDVLEVLKPFFYYIEEADEDTEPIVSNAKPIFDNLPQTQPPHQQRQNNGEEQFNGEDDFAPKDLRRAKLSDRSDPRVFTLQRIFKVASEEHWF